MGADAGPMHGPLLPAIVYLRHQDVLILLDPRTGEVLHLDATSTAWLRECLLGAGTYFPALRETAGFVTRALDS